MKPTSAQKSEEKQDGKKDLVFGTGISESAIFRLKTIVVTSVTGNRTPVCRVRTCYPNR